MSDVVAIFLEPLPWRVKLNDEWWRVAACPQGKSGRQVRVNAYDEKGDRNHTLWSGNAAAVRDIYQSGFVVKGGTPARGLVTALRRCGLVKLVGPGSDGKLRVRTTLERGMPWLGDAE